MLTSEHPLETVALVAHKTAGDRHGTCALIGELGGSGHWGERREGSREEGKKEEKMCDYNGWSMCLYTRK